MDEIERAEALLAEALAAWHTGRSRKAAEIIAAALRSAQVPEEATDAMCQAAHEAQLGRIEPDGHTSYGPVVSMNAIYRAMYKAMLAAAPSAEGEA